MFFVCKKVGNKYGVIDTDDGVIELLSPEQLCDYAKRLKIHGVDFKKTGVIIRVVTPSAFTTVNEYFHSIDLYDEKISKAKAQKLSFAGVEPFYKMFSSIDLGGNIPKLMLQFVSWEDNMLGFSYAYDYSTRANYTNTEIATKLSAIYDKSVYKKYTKFEKAKLFYPNIPFIFIPCPYAYKEYIKSQLIDLRNDMDAQGKVKNQGASFTFENLILETVSLHTNIGRCLCYNILFNYNGLTICLEYGCRASALYDDIGTSDSLDRLIDKLK